jgi:hypothetical protein
MARRFEVRAWIQSVQALTRFLGPTDLHSRRELESLTPDAGG